MTLSYLHLRVKMSALKVGITREQVLLELVILLNGPAVYMRGQAVQFRRERVDQDEPAACKEPGQQLSESRGVRFTRPIAVGNYLAYFFGAGAFQHGGRLFDKRTYRLAQGNLAH